MATITLGDNTLTTCGDLPAVGSTATDFTLVATDLANKSLSDYHGQTIILNIFPSIDTGICAASTREFNAQMNQAENTVVLCISKDLPFALERFCGAEGLDKVVPLSAFRSTFGTDYGVEMDSGILSGLLSRAVVVIKDAKIVYTEQVPEIAQEPNYAAAMEAAK